MSLREFLNIPLAQQNTAHPPLDGRKSDATLPDSQVRSAHRSGEAPVLFREVQIRELSEQLDRLTIVRPRHLDLVIVQVQVEVRAICID